MPIETRFGGGRTSSGARELPQYDIAAFCQKHGISAAKARDILEKAGDSRETADVLAKRSKPMSSWD
jgi:hypothetical protein